MCSHCSRLRCRPQPASEPAGVDPARPSDALTPQDPTVARRPAAACRAEPRPAERGADTKPLFELHHVSIAGARAFRPTPSPQPINPISASRCRRPTSPTIAAAIGDTYRAAGFHFSRAIVPPQDIEDGHGSHPGHRRQHRRGGAEGRGREHSASADAGRGRGRAAARLATLERQLMLINGRPGVRIEDTQLEEIGTASGQFPPDVISEDLAPLRLRRPRQSRLVRGRPVAELCDRGLQLHDRPGDTLALNLSPRPAIRASSLRQAVLRCPSASTGCGSAPPASTAKSGPATAGGCLQTTPRPRRSNCAAALCR